MERVLRLSRVASSPLAVVLLVAFNLVPLAGVLWWGWNVQSLLILYWLENGIIGLLSIARILRAEGPLEAAGVRISLVGTATASRLVMVPFFVMHYGTFWVVHGIFVFTLPPLLGAPGVVDAPFAPPTSQSFVRWDAIAFGAVGLAISHTASLVLNYIGRGEYRRTSPAAQTTAPYGRVIVLHMTIILGVFASHALGSSIGALVVLVALKTVVDLGLHLAAHRGAAPSPVFAGT